MSTFKHCLSFTLRKLISSGLLIAALQTSSLAYSAQLEFVNNGSFETTKTTLTKSTIVQSGSTTITGWNIGTGSGNGYTFLALPGTAGSSINGSNGIRLWDKGDGGITSVGNGGLNLIPKTSPDGGKFIVSDGAYQITTLYQTISGLTVGSLYQLKFWQAAGQQTNFSGDTLNAWQVSFGTSLTTTNSIKLPNGQTYTSTTQVVTGGTSQLSHIMANKSHGFYGWEQQTMTFKATAQSQLLGFMAVGGPLGQPPFSLIDGISMTQVPEPSSIWLLIISLTGFGFMRKRLQK